MELPGPSGGRSTLPLLEINYHLYLPYSLFSSSDRPSTISTAPVTAAMDSSVSVSDKCSSMRHIINRVHRHICGDVTYSDMGTLVKRNKIWSADVAKFMSTVLVLNSLPCCINQTLGVSTTSHHTARGPPGSPASDIGESGKCREGQSRSPMPVCHLGNAQRPDEYPASVPMLPQEVAEGARVVETQDAALPTLIKTSATSARLSQGGINMTVAALIIGPSAPGLDPFETIISPFATVVD